MKPDIALLVPGPKEATSTAAELDLSGSIGVLVEGAAEQTDRAKQHLERCLATEGLRYHRLDSDSKTSGTQVILTGGVSGMASPDAYRLTASSDCIRISAASGSGLFYGVSTLAQWIRLHQDEGGTPASTLTGLEVDDRPSFAHRGVMLDVSRNKMPTMATLFTLVDQLARWKINQLSSTSSTPSLTPSTRASGAIRVRSLQARFVNSTRTARSDSSNWCPTNRASATCTGG